MHISYYNTDTVHYTKNISIIIIIYIYITDIKIKKIIYK